MKGNVRKREILKTRDSKQMEEKITILIVCEDFRYNFELLMLEKIKKLNSDSYEINYEKVRC